MHHLGTRGRGQRALVAEVAFVGGQQVEGVVGQVLVLVLLAFYLWQMGNELGKEGVGGTLLEQHTHDDVLVPPNAPADEMHFQRGMSAAHLVLALGVEMELAEGKIIEQSIGRLAVSKEAARLLLELDGMAVVYDFGRGLAAAQLQCRQVGVQHRTHEVDGALVGSGAACAAAHIVPAGWPTEIVVAPFVVGIGFVAGVFHFAVRAGEAVGAEAGSVGASAAVLTGDTGAGVGSRGLVFFAGGHNYCEAEHNEQQIKGILFFHFFKFKVQWLPTLFRIFGFLLFDFNLIKYAIQDMKGIVHPGIHQCGCRISFDLIGGKGRPAIHFKNK